VSSSLLLCDNYILPTSADERFVKADSRNLSKEDVFMIGEYLNKNHCYNQGYFLTERHSGSSFSEGRKRERCSRTFFFPSINITRLGMSCYPTALLSNKLAQRPLKFQQVTANNSLDFVQFLEGKGKRNSSRPNFGLLHAFRNFFFMEK
jgi:hypothetical protein